MTDSTADQSPSVPSKAVNSSRRNFRLRLRLPRTLLLWWSIWLLLSWVLAFGWSSPFVPTLRAYGSSVGKLLVLLSIGLVIVWPLFRLSAQNRGAPRIVALIDFIAIVVTLQVILWPMRISGQWEIMRLFALDWTLCAWALLVAAAIAFGSTPPRLRAEATVGRGGSTTPRGNFLRANGRRAFWMLVCIFIAILGPAVALLFSPTADGAVAAEAFFWSPIGAVWWMSTHTLDPPERAEWLRLIILTSAGLLIWTVLLTEAGLRSRQRGNEALNG